jgi:hypothetical protein
MVTVKISVFWDIMMCSVVDNDQHGDSEDQCLLGCDDV